MYNISVIIPNYNRADLLVKAVQSVLKQNYPVKEILVCDDGSTDNSEELVRNISVKDKRVIWINCGKNGRPAIPRNIGIEKAGGEWLAFLDNDDTWHKNKISEQINAAELAKTLAICTNANRLTPDEKPCALLSFDKDFIDFNDLLKTNWVICSSMMIHRSLISVTGGFPENSEFKAIEDYALWLRIATQTKITYISSPLVDYLDLPASSIRNEGYNVFEQKCVVLNDLLIWMKNNRNVNREFSRKAIYELKKVQKENTKVKIKKVLYKIKKTIGK